ncbi:hypothetical protein [Legionella gresilensis]|uniref:hypothetical protein n=1 Tax=Legionella gresilensis TaxID=91823 RepID=UPI001041AABD|nr:hypothetical protein [Legionella gresilensis]
MNKKLSNKLEKWFKARNQKGNPQVFGSKNIYIVPSAFGWAYAFVLITLFTAAINYQISLIFLMVFLLSLIGMGSAWEAHANLKELGLKLLTIDDAEEESLAQIHLLIQPNKKIRYGLVFQCIAQEPIIIEEALLNEFKFILSIKTGQRGCFKLPTIKITSFYPLGLFKVWGYAYFDRQFYVYPKPVFPGFWPMPVSLQEKNEVALAGDNEVYDLKQVENPWAQPNLIAWKIVAKSQGWFIKTMDSVEGDYWLFQLQDLPAIDLEGKLRFLSYWVQAAEARDDLYSLKLGTQSTKFSHGESHLKQCLRQLATYS